MGGKRNSSKIAFAIILIAIVGVSVALINNNYNLINSPAGFQSSLQTPQTNIQNTPAGETQTGQQQSAGEARPEEQVTLTPTGAELIFKELDSNQPYTIEYEFKYPSRIGYEFSFTKNVDFYVGKPYSRQALADRDVSSKIGKFDVNNGEQGKWELTFVPKEGELKGTFKIIEILKFE